MKPQNSSRLFEITLVALLMAIYLYAALSESHNFATQWFIRDDAFYYFKVAQNISEGRGVTFDGVNITNGFHPLWMIVCIPIFALARFDLILPLRLLVVVSGAISAATGVLLFRLIGRTLSPPAAILAAAYWCFDRLIHYNVTMFGLETGLTALTMVALLYTLADIEQTARQTPLTPRQIWMAGGLAVLMIFSRLDTVFVAGLAGAWILLRGTSARQFLFWDAIVIVSAAFISVAARAGLPQYFVYTNSAIVLAALGLLIQIPAFCLFGLYQHSTTKITNYREASRRDHLRFTLATLVASAIVALGMLGLSAGGVLPGLPRSALPVYAGIVLLGAGVVRLAAGGHPPRKEFGDLLRSWRVRLPEGVRYFGLLGLILAAYMGFNKLTLGTFTPVSGQIKRWWGTLQGSSYGNPISTLSDFLGLSVEEGINAWGPVMYMLKTVSAWFDGDRWLGLAAMIGMAGLILAIRPKRAARAGIRLGLPVLLGGSILQLFYYNGLGYAGAKDWYWVSQMVMFTLFGALLLDLLLYPLRKLRAGRILAWAATALACLWLVVAFASVIIQRMPWGAERAGQPYMDVLPFLESNTEEGARIGMTGGGNIGYFIAGRTIVNMDGLINSYAYFRALQTGRGDEYMAAVGLDYVFSNPDILERSPYNSQFSERLEFVAEYGRKDLMRYRHD